MRRPLSVYSTVRCVLYCIVGKRTWQAGRGGRPLRKSSAAKSRVGAPPCSFPPVRFCQTLFALSQGHSLRFSCTCSAAKFTPAEVDLAIQLSHKRSGSSACESAHSFRPSPSARIDKRVRRALHYAHTLVRRAARTCPDRRFPQHHALVGQLLFVLLQLEPSPFPATIYTYNIFPPVKSHGATDAGSM